MIVCSWAQRLMLIQYQKDRLWILNSTIKLSCSLSSRRLALVYNAAVSTILRLRATNYIISFLMLRETNKTCLMLRISSNSSNNNISNRIHNNSLDNLSTRSSQLLNSYIKWCKTTWPRSGPTSALKVSPLLPILWASSTRLQCPNSINSHTTNSLSMTTKTKRRARKRRKKGNKLMPSNSIRCSRWIITWVWLVWDGWRKLEGRRRMLD